MGSFSQRVFKVIKVVKGESLSTVAVLGEEWKEQKRYTQRCLREMGLGKSSQTDQVILREFSHLAKEFDRTEAAGQDINSEMLFNVAVVNIIWGLVAGMRYGLYWHSSKNTYMHSTTR